jgi:acetyltransferase-like isoleucine patch superfamily enzyme
MSRVRHGVYASIEILVRLCIVPAWRARLLSLLGADIGRNVRIGDCRFINLSKGFMNLHVGDNAHIGAGCLVDLEGPVSIGERTTLSPRVTVMSHADPGSAHGSPHILAYPVEVGGVNIGRDCWIGASSTLLSGADVGDGAVVGAMALVRGRLEPGGVYVGVPARRIADSNVE